MAATNGTFQELIGPEAWRSLLATGSLRSFQPGRSILRQGELGGFLFAVESGRVKLLASAADGVQLVLTVRGGGHLIGELAGDSDGTRTASVVAIDRCTARFLTQADFDRFLYRHDLHGSFRRYVTGKFEQAVGRQVDLAHRRAVRRISRLLLDLVRLAPDGLPDARYIPFTQEELATALGMARSTVTDQLSKLRESGALAPGRQLVVADVDRLAEWAES
ncbi:Crp/Fnr family transcriptional regulator [Kribbella sp. CA-253562]|uniref:Crp/Fnr family transcriptional regulator n=1 Tax=Kribbella sp. CA-253562 TaxID=3239942 RepID=UPI003D8B1D6D